MLAPVKKVVLGCLLGIMCFAAQASTHEWLVSGHPDVYVVQEGDTLWDIAGRFLHDPWRWKEVWRASPEVNNPNLIYPGDRIVLSMNGDNLPELRVQRAHSQGAVKISRSGETIYKLSPRVRSLPAQEAIPTIPMNVIGPFLSQTMITEPNFLEDAYCVSALDEEHLLAGEDKRFYSQNLPWPEGATLSVYQQGSLLVHPVTGNVLGEEAIYLGMAEVERGGDMVALKLRESAKEIRIGDKLVEIDQPQIEPYFLPKKPVNDGHGYILSVLDGVNQIGQYNVVTISGGFDMGRDQGDVLSIYQTKHDFPRRIVKEQKFQRQMHPSDTIDYYRFPPVLAGRLIIFRVFEQASMALVTDANRPIYLHDIVRTP